MTRDKITARIKALLAKAQSTEHEAEATAFMAKAQQLLEEYQIDLGSLEDGDDPVRVFTDGLQRTQKDATWHKKLYTALAVLYGCKVVYSPAWVRNQPGFTIELTGRESAVVTTGLMYPWVKSQCEAQGRALAKDYPNMTASQHTRRVANALVNRIYRLAQTEKVQPRTVAAAKNALVTVDRVEQIFNDHYGNSLSKSRSRSIVSSAAARDAANKIGLHRQTTGSSTPQITKK